VRRLLASRLAAAIVCVVLAALVAVGVFLLVDDGGGLPTAPQASVDVAHDFAIAATTFDYRRIEADRDRVLAFGTPELRRDFTAAMGDAFAERAAETRRVSVGEIVAGPTVQAVTDERAELLVVLNQRVVSDSEDSPDPQVVRVTMLVTVETDDDPLVTRVRVL
jgi:hypothetical protein